MDTLLGHGVTTVGCTGSANANLFSYDCYDCSGLIEWVGRSDMNEIGGSKCHLCDEEKTHEDTYGNLTKHGQWVTTRTVYYRCETWVLVSKKGRKTVHIGKKCIRINLLGGSA